MSKSWKLHDLTTEQETNTSTIQPRKTEEEQENSDDYEIEEIQCYITLSEFPGGSEKFETLWSSLMCKEFSDSLLIKKLGFNFYRSQLLDFSFLLIF